MRRCTPPSRPAIASWAARRPRASIRAARASARVRSRRPLRKARWLNSPGLARRAPALSTSSSTRRTASRPPWQCSSTTSSRVKLRGARISSSSASSARSPLMGSTTWPYSTRWLSHTWLPGAWNSRRPIASAAGPERRTIATLPAPAATAVAIAAMVSPSAGAPGEACCGVGARPLGSLTATEAGARLRSGCMTSDSAAGVRGRPG